jgi:hypothetical protein
MNYQLIYTQLINRGKTRELTGYKERHHIIPKCIGGNDNPDNLVYLTAREHFIAHKLLCEIHPDDTKLFHAYWMMSTTNITTKFYQREYKVSSYEYDRLKTKAAEISRARFINQPKSEEHKQKLRKPKTEAHKKHMSQSFKGRKFSIETRKKLSIANTGNIHSEETKRKISNTMRGRITSEETRKKLSDAKKGRKFSEEHKQKLREAKLNKKNQL